MQCLHSYEIAVGNSGYSRIFEFNIKKLLAFIQANPTRFPVEMIQISALPFQGSGESLNEETIKTAILSNPIVLAEISPGRFNVIDGNHRTERARREGAGTVLAYRVAAEQHVPFMKTVRGYEAYVKYWNQKLKEAAEP